MTLIIVMVIFGLICLIAGVKGDNKKDPSAGSGVHHCPNCGAPLRPGARECGCCGDCW